MAGIASQAFEMLGVRAEVRYSRIDDAACALRELCEARPPRGFAWSLQYEPKPLLDQILELSAAQCRLRFGTAVEIVGYFDCCLHDG
jgi:hypothetical protein